MIAVQIKSVIYELRQCGSVARTCMYDMLVQSDTRMRGFRYRSLTPPSDSGVQIYAMPLLTALKKYEKYNYDQNALLSLQLALDD